MTAEQSGQQALEPLEVHGRRVARPLVPRLLRLSERLFLFLMLAIFALIFFVPFYWVVTASIKETAELRMIPPTWWPQSFTLQHYVDVWTPRFARYFLNTFVYAGGTTIIVIVTCPLLAFAMVKFPSTFGNLVFGVIIATMMVPFATYVVPLHGLLVAIERNTGIPMLNTYWGMILPWMMHPFGVFLMRQAMFGVPDELLDAARIDGASTLGTFWRVVMPLVRTYVVTLAIFMFIFKYDDLLWPLVVATDQDMYPLTVGLVEFIGTFFVEYGLFTAASVSAIVPVVILYIFLQRYILEGVALSGLKG